ncbi:TRAFAC clade GTPase domain-containing protein [Pseudomonas graminis]
MSKRTIVLVGGPDSGKTNYMARLWASIAEGRDGVGVVSTPENIKYVEDAVTHLHGGSFAPRTDKNLEAGQGALTITLKREDGSDTAELVIPDVSGEVWKAAVESGEFSIEGMQLLESAQGGLLFVRVLSDQNITPLDWVNSAALMEVLGGDFEGYPTQVMLCEMARFLEEKLRKSEMGSAPRIAVVVTAWDLLDRERAEAGPRAYLSCEYPLFIGKLDNLEGIDVEVFGMSIVGGDLEADIVFRDLFLERDFESTGFIVTDGGDGLETSTDLTLPIIWAAGSA